MPNTKIKKVVAKVEERYVEPDYIAIYKCPFCGRKYGEDIYTDNTTETVVCESTQCKKKFKVKIPKCF